MRWSKQIWVIATSLGKALTFFSNLVGKEKHFVLTRVLFGNVQEACMVKLLCLSCNNEKLLDDDAAL